LRALAAGRALVVFDHGWYSELPDDSCIKIPLLDETALVSVMSQLAQHSHFRQQLGEYGRQYIKNEHLPNYVAKAYASFIYDQLGRLRSRFTNSDFDESQ
ncbi:MAG: glycosyltransferase, partial [Anaerolineae bacterium]|nr:glycosyltransferase [Anaerolineae bacterium]